ncbi:MAG: hypothetical protein P8011_00565 [Acidihalobacter sp.]|jgi:uncharacterized membrane protein YciS (DUF1049 family)|uniref:hypothetical protein n=1 Tax=Acidihalobacter sp. TaxID=1872108 RepID=UPI00307F5B2E
MNIELASAVIFETTVCVLVADYVWRVSRLRAVIVALGSAVAWLIAVWMTVAGMAS